MKYVSSYKISVDFQPWFSNGFRFSKVKIYEEVGGVIPRGEIDLMHDGTKNALNLITNQNTGTLTIEKEGGNVYNIQIFVTDRVFYKNLLTLKFVCTSDKKFYTELISTEWKGIDPAIESLYPGTKDIRCKTDIDPALKIYQNGETNYSLCRKLSLSYKNRCIFAFSWDRLIIKELIGIDSNGFTEPKLEITGNTQLHQIDSYVMTYDKKLYHKVYNPWEPEEGKDYSELQAINCRSLLFYSDYYIVKSDYTNLLTNYINNIKYINSNMFESFRVVNLDMPRYRVGDIVIYRRDEQDSKLPFTYFLVRSNELFISIEGSKEVDYNGLHFSWTSMLSGVQDINGTLLPLGES